MNSIIKSHYIKKGNGKAVVLLHGFLEDSTIWDTLTNSLQEHFLFVIPDLLGHGRTESVSEIHSMDMMADAVNHILESEGIEQCVFIGHSMGGYVSLAFCEKYPEKVCGIMLMNSTCVADSQEKKANRDRVVEVIDKEKTLFVRTAITNLFGSENKIKMKNELERLVEIAMLTPNEGIKAAALGMKNRPDSTSLLASMSIPKHFIIGKNDALIPFEDALSLAKQTGASYSLLDGGHLAYIENFSETVEIIRTFALTPRHNSPIGKE